MTVLLVVLAVIAVAAAVAWWFRTHPSACPYAVRFFVQTPHPIITRNRLREILDPHRGERILEIGPGTGYYTLDMAEWVGPRGRVAIFDLQQKFLDHTMRRVGNAGLETVEPTRGNAEKLPYEGESFDAAVLITVLGEIPNEGAALRELRRVLVPGGRLIIGELALGDPHYVGFSALTEAAGGASFRPERRLGGRLGYFARFIT
jgi:SAM-dependent methyltransferase